MTSLSVQAQFEALGLQLNIVTHQASTATVELAAQAFGVEAEQIAKTLAVRLASGQVVLVVASGTKRLDNAKLKQVLGRGKMVSRDEVVALTGHPVGGVCPFGLVTPLPI
ncbi:MAG: YbaK/EbsC family protein, partial [Burkholderiaceae bacterium]